MKKIIGSILILTSILLFITNSMYVEWDEIFIIIGSASVISIIYNLFLRTNRKYSNLIISSAFIGLFLSSMFSIIDLFIDHYRVIQGIPDGRFLALSETLLEFSDDLLILVLIVTCSVTLASIIGTTIYLKFSKS